MSVGGTVLSKYGKKVLDWMLSKVTVKVEVDSRDEVFRWVLDWLSDQEYAKRVTRVMATTNISKIYGNRETEFESLEKEAEKGPHVYFSPSPGLHWLSWREKWLWIERKREEEGSGTMKSHLKEVMEISMIASSTLLLRQFIQQAKEHSLEKDKIKTSIYTSSLEGNWQRSTSKLRRPMDSVILPLHLKQQVITDVKAFLGSEKWYSMMGIPWRRGYLLYGPPGTGFPSQTIFFSSSFFDCFQKKRKDFLHNSSRRNGGEAHLRYKSRQHDDD